MYRLQPIQDAMLARIGFRQTTNPQLPQLIPQLTQSESGIFVQDKHPLLNTNNLYMASENFDQWPYEDWELPVLPDTGYDLNAYVKHNAAVWVSTQDDNTDEPGATAAWEEVNNFSQYLVNILRNASQKTVEGIFQAKKLERNTKTIFENIHLFDGSAGRSINVIRQGRFVGFSVRLLKHRHITLLLRKIGTQFTGAASFKLYVYHEGMQAPYATVQINHVTANTFQWNNITDLTLPYVDANKDAGGLFYIGYYEDDLPVGVQAVSRNDYRWDTAPCAVCGGAMNDRNFFQKWSPFQKWVPIMVPAGMIQPAPDRAKFPNFSAGYTYDQNFGLNFHLTLRCDLTDFILENIELLDDTYGNEIAYGIINSMAYTLRDNGDAKQLRDKAVYEMTRTDGAGLPKQREASYKALDYDMSGFNTVCLPDSRRGVRTGAMI